jgi:hypothetical protein
VDFQEPGSLGVVLTINEGVTGPGGVRITSDAVEQALLDNDFRLPQVESFELVDSLTLLIRLFAPGSESQLLEALDTIAFPLEE